MYLLNLLFDFNQGNGRFTGDRGKDPLVQSMNWLKLNGPEPPDPVPNDFPDALPAGSSWEDLGEARTLLLPSTPAPGHNIGIRVAPFPVAALPAGSEVQLVVSFGRPAKQNLPTAIASPFTDNGAVRTTFVLGPRGRPPAAWYLNLGKIDPGARPNKRDISERFEFSVGVIVRDVVGGVTRYYGEDPEMDVGQ